MRSATELMAAILAGREVKEDDMQASWDRWMQTPEGKEAAKKTTLSLEVLRQ